MRWYVKRAFNTWNPTAIVFRFTCDKYCQLWVQTGSSKHWKKAFLRGGNSLNAFFLSVCGERWMSWALSSSAYILYGSLGIMSVHVRMCILYKIIDRIVKKRVFRISKYSWKLCGGKSSIERAGAFQKEVVFGFVMFPLQCSHGRRHSTFECLECGNHFDFVLDFLRSQNLRGICWEAWFC